MNNLSDVNLLLQQSGFPEEKQGRVRALMGKRLDREVKADEKQRARRSNGFKTSDYTDYEDMEALIEAMLLDDMTEGAAKAAAAYTAVVQAGGQAAIGKALDAFETLMREVFTNNTEKIIQQTVERLVDKGALVAGLEQGLRDTIAKNDVIEGIMDSAKWYTNSHFDRVVMPEIYGKLDDIAALNLSPVQHVAQVRELAMRDIDAANWRLRLTANGAASKGYHYGVVKGGWDAGFRVYRFSALLDERTSEVCTHLNGREFAVADAVTVAERRTQGQPEDVKTFAPWFSEGDLFVGSGEMKRAKTNQELSSMGCIIPPLHGNCRSSITLI